MGRYLNPGIGRFVEATNGQIYVDKTEMIAYLNTLVRTPQKYLCVSRPRRFGKTMALDMLCAYYGQGEGARELFCDLGLKLTRTEPARLAGGRTLAWDAYLGAFDVLRLTMTDFFTRGEPVADGIGKLRRAVAREIVRAYPELGFSDPDSLAECMADVYYETGRAFVVVIDEWDAPMRERQDDPDGQRAYLDFLRGWLKDQEYVALAYLTGILPVKKYGAHSALNMFNEYSMVAALQLAPYTGFTEEEVRELCPRFGVGFEDVRAWYDGYRLVQPVEVPSGEPCGGVRYERRVLSLYNPLSVVSALRTGLIQNWWNKTETYEALAAYIRMDFDGLRETVALLMDGGRAQADLGTYQNDMTTLGRKDDVLALLIHLGYLGWDSEAGEVFVPNREIMDEFRASTHSEGWDLAFRAYERSKELVRATWEAKEARVAELLDDAHDRAGNQTYNSEAALSYAVRLAYFAAQRWYTEVVELDSGKGYADVAYLPSPSHPELPALLVELKWRDDADAAVAQVRDRRYPARLAHYEGNLLLVGISYDRDARPGEPGYKRHRCRIERA